jgi:hypothetical protein
MLVLLLLAASAVEPHGDACCTSCPLHVHSRAQLTGAFVSSCCGTPQWCGVAIITELGATSDPAAT